MEFNLQADISNSSILYLKEIMDYLYESKTTSFEVKFTRDLKKQVTFIDDNKSYKFQLGKIFIDCEEELKSEIIELNTDYLQLVYSGVTMLYDSLLTVVSETFEKIKKGKVVDTDPIQEVEIDPVSLNHTNHKLIYLDELGVLSFLLKEHEILKRDRDTSLAKLLYPFLEDPNKGKAKTIETSRKIIAGLLSSKGINKTRTEPAMKKVKSELFKLEIKI